MKKILFLDRDGVLNKEIGTHSWTLDQFEILPDVIPALQKMKNLGYEFVIITNQSGIALGLYKHRDVETVHKYLLEELRKADIFVLEIYYCPHHPEHGSCLCRKPGSVMIEKALARFNADPSACLMVGDRERDVMAAGGAGVKGILIDSNSSLLKALERI